ncbi:MAG TPA: preprotein translocase subunit SecA [Firmicutes bacterium]|nr:preprotein translocase subunit SecA [Bacillota bacterium]
MGLFSFFANADNRKSIKRLQTIVDKVNAQESRFAAMSDDELRGMTDIFRDRLRNNYETLNDILPEAFAVVREAGKRVLEMRHFDVQIMGGACLHQGRIAEMRTGEGKTLVATLPAYLNALEGKGVHIVTVNDYLAKRDAEWMGKIHRFLGLTVGVAVSGMDNKEKRAAYACDITYATNNELGFDYLRDNMVTRARDKVQRELNFAIIDEVDSILIDEARTPLIISGRGGKSSEMYVQAQAFARTLKPDDYEIEEKKKAINLSESGITKAEKFFNVENLADLDNTELNHYINNALRANFIMKRDQDYIVDKNEVLIVDEFTGRVMVGRRYSEGLHQAIEAKEHVRIQSENKTMATITFQNFFRLYPKLSGMTGTAKTEETEFKGIYNLDVVTIPTNKPNARIDENDVIYKTVKAKLDAVVADITDCYMRGQPVLVGTTTVEKSEHLSTMLRHNKIPHSVLNAKNHEREAEIIAQAGKKGSVTIATNMAGRGTDILLGGNPEYLALQRMRKEGMPEEEVSAAVSYYNTDDEAVLHARAVFRQYYDEFKKETDKNKAEVIAVGGLRIIGTERHESRRIDNQLRGRAGRQGDIGSTIFYLSMEDDVLRLFGGERMQAIANAFGTDDNTPLSMGLLSKAIENAQRSIEGRNYDIRKQVLEYDNVMNQQRTIIYSERNKVLYGENIHNEILAMMKDEVSVIVDDYTDPHKDWPEWDYEELNKEIERKLLPGDPEFLTRDRLEKWTLSEIKDQIYNAMMAYYDAKIDSAKQLGLDFSEVERVILLRAVDFRWMDHIDQMDFLRRGIGLKAYGNQDPVIAYKKEGFDLFERMNANIQSDTVSMLMHVNIEKAPSREEKKVDLVMSGGSEGAKSPRQAQAVSKKIGRNDPCPCGSGKKYKNCCGKNQ